jgi:hypothetical protein
MNVSLTGDSRINSTNAPVIIITKQSTSPNFLGKTNGIIGLAYRSLTREPQSPYTLFDSWLDNGKIIKNQIAIRGCPYSLINSSWIDFGNIEGYAVNSKCGNLNVKAFSPSKTYFTINITGLKLNNAYQPLFKFQEQGYSFVDSCSSHISLPLPILTTFQGLLRNSNGFPADLGNSILDRFTNGIIKIKFRKSDIDWTKLPFLSVGHLNPNNRNTRRK